MQKMELNRATIGVANRTDISGRATADETAANRFTQAAFGGLVVGTANTVESYGGFINAGWRVVVS